MKIRIKNKFAARRRAEYPDLAEQLDALWHGMNMDESRRIEPFYSMIKSVKDKHKKAGGHLDMWYSQGTITTQ